MSESIPRWDFIPLDNPVHGIEVHTGPHRGDYGVFVLYSDHVAAVAAALNADQDRRIAGKVTFLDGFSEGVDAARDAVEALPNRYAMEPGHVALILAAIDALEKPA